MPLNLPNQKTNASLIPNIFIDKYMPKANPAYSIVYIYGYSQCIRGNTEITNSTIAAALDMLESDIVRAWRYWQTENVVIYNEETSAVEFNAFSEPVPSAAPMSSVVIEKRPHYAPEEISVYIDKSVSVKQLFSSAQNYLGKLLSHNDMSTLFSFYDWLRLPMGVIEILLAYCVQNDHRSMRYIEKVAIDWAEAGINTPEKAAAHIKLYNNDYREIMKAFGQGNRNPTPSEEEFMKKWVTVYKMPIELISIACEKTIMGAGKTNFPYADSIITSWYKNNVKNHEDIKRLEADFNASKTAKAQQSKQTTQTKTTQYAPKKNRFVNYEQRDWDFAELEKLEKEYLNNDLNNK